MADTGDFAEIVKKRSQDEKCKLAFEVFVDRIIGYLGSYAFKLASYGGVDALVFSGGIGEASPELRCALAERLQNTNISMLSGKEAQNEQDVVVRMVDESKGFKDGVIPWLVCKVSKVQILSLDCRLIDFHSLPLDKRRRRMCKASCGPPSVSQVD